jgi:hypothetical protein
MKFELARPGIRASANFTAHEPAAIGFRIRTRHGGERHAELRRQLALRRKPFPWFETTGLDFAGNGIGNLAVDRLAPFLASGEGNCHPCNMSFDEDCSQT